LASKKFDRQKPKGLRRQATRFLPEQINMGKFKHKTTASSLLRQKSKKKPVLTCGICNTIFRSADLFETHCITHSTDNYILCRVCNEYVIVHDYEEHIGSSDHKRNSTQLRRANRESAEPVVPEPIEEEQEEQGEDENKTDSLVQEPEEVGQLH
jgi:hypothetical protein